MKGNEKIISLLNGLQADELTAINQYIHSEMCANCGYGKLHGKTEKHAIDEMKFAEKIIACISSIAIGLLGVGLLGTFATLVSTL